MPMSPRLLRPRATGFHPEAQDWRNRVIANGGTVSGSTLLAVSKFCRDIDAAGIRSRFLRLSLLCGGNLSSALVPLYRNTSFTGSVLGNTTDTNSNFVSGDYAETGSTGGLLGNGTSKALDTGLAGNSAAFGSLHLSVYVVTAPTTGAFRPAIVSRSTTNADEASLQHNQTPLASTPYFAEENTVTGFVAGTTNNPTGHLVGSSVSSTDRRLYLSGSQQGSTVTNALTRTQYPTATFRVFNNNFNGTFSNARLASYSVGSGLTAAQVLAFYNAMQTFQTALSRNV